MRYNYGDVDVFFPTAAAYDATFRRIAKAQFEGRIVTMMRSPLNVATNVYTTNSAIKVQLIETFTGDPVTVMEQFDMVNCMHALSAVHPSDRSDLRLTYEVRNDEIERRERLIDVERWGTPWTFFRVMKYLTRYGYNGLTQRTQDAIVEKAIELIESLTTQPIKFKAVIDVGEDPCRGVATFATRLMNVDAVYDTKKVISVLTPLPPHLDVRNLLKMMTVYGQVGDKMYARANDNPAVSELCRRILLADKGIVR